MENSIKQKLADALTSEISQECQVMYILVEVRKFLDVAKVAGFSSLRMYCNWVVHDKLSLPNAEADALLKAFDEAKEAQSKGFGYTAHIPYLSLSNFRNELRRFLMDNSLPTNIVDDENQWKAFLYLYTTIIEDCPIEYAASRSDLKHIAKATLYSSILDDSKQGPYYDERKMADLWLRWRFDHKDGTVSFHEFLK